MGLSPSTPMAGSLLTAPVVKKRQWLGADLLDAKQIQSETMELYPSQLCFIPLGIPFWA